MARHRARRREGNSDFRGGAGSLSPGPAERGEPERTGNTALIIGVAGLLPCGLGRPLKTGQASERSAPVRDPDQLGHFMATSVPVPCPVSTVVMSLPSVVPRRGPPAAWQMSKRGTGRPIIAAIIVEHSPLTGRDEAHAVSVPWSEARRCCRCRRSLRRSADTRNRGALYVGGRALEPVPTSPDGTASSSLINPRAAACGRDRNPKGRDASLRLGRSGAEIEPGDCPCRRPPV